MGSGGPLASVFGRKLPPPAPAPAVPSRKAAAIRAEDERKARLKRKGRAATVITSPLAVQEQQAETEKVTLLGQ